jgi:YfiH family protein
MNFNHRAAVEEVNVLGEPLPAWRVPSWQALPGLVHMFLGRLGGASSGPWTSLNLSRSVGDDAAAVEENWIRVKRAAPGLAIVKMGQVHGAAVVRVDAPVATVDAADGLVTGANGLGLAVLTADCVPILMIGPANRVALAVHAGWRGTLVGIAQVAVTRARAEFDVAPGDLRVALGPAIGGCCYEVDLEIGRQLEARWGPLGIAWRIRGDKGLLDLRQLNRGLLVSAGVRPEAIEMVGPCTACHMRSFFSHRGSGGKTGRQLSLVGWL